MTAPAANPAGAAPVPDEAAEQAPGPQAVGVSLAYAAPSGTAAPDGNGLVTFYGNLRRDPVRLDAVLADPLRFREAMSALYAVVGSDYRYVPKDRTAYLAFVRMRRESAGLGAWQSQQAYYEFLLRNDPSATLILDPILTVHPDALLLEVFSKDEGTYASLSLCREAFEADGSVSYGSSNIDFGKGLFDALQQVRGYRRTRLSIRRDPAGETPGAPAAGTPMPAEDAGGAKPGDGEAKAGVLEKRIRVSDSWLRGFLQVQSAATLPADTFAVAPVDLYNLLRHLRLHKDQKGKRRGLRVELVPGEYPRLVLEPWEVVLRPAAEKYKGRAAKVVRLWGRRRLMLLQRVLPFVKTVDVHLIGSGLPSFWVFRGEGGLTFTLGLTGFTSANWSQAVSFDLLLPRKTRTSPEALAAVIRHLSKVWHATTKDLSAATGLKGPDLLEALQAGCQQGRLMYDLAAEVYRLRALTDEPLDLARLEYRNPRERTAHDLLVRRGAVRIVSENRIAGAGLELTGKVTVEEDKREYRPQMLLSDEGQVGRAECTCALFRKQGLKGGPCEHLIALRLAHAERERRRAEGRDERSTVTVETRTYSRRDRAGVEAVVQVSLERQRLKVRRGTAGQPMRLQTLKFNSPDEARAAYFARVDGLGAKGFLDATGG